MTDALKRLYRRSLGTKSRELLESAKVEEITGQKEPNLEKEARGPEVKIEVTPIPIQVATSLSDGGGASSMSLATPPHSPSSSNLLTEPGLSRGSSAREDSLSPRCSCFINYNEGVMNPLREDFNREVVPFCFYCGFKAENDNYFSCIAYTGYKMSSGSLFNKTGNIPVYRELVLCEPCYAVVLMSPPYKAVRYCREAQIFYQ